MAEKNRDPWNPLRKSYPESEKVNAVSLGAETLFTRLLAQCDDNANYYGSPSLVAAYLYGHRLDNGSASIAKVKGWIGELCDMGLTQNYRVNEKEYLHVIKCKKSLRGDIKADVRFPQVKQSQGCTESVTNPARTRNESGPRGGG